MSLLTHWIKQQKGTALAVSCLFLLLLMACGLPVYVYVKAPVGSFDTEEQASLLVEEGYPPLSRERVIFEIPSGIPELEGTEIYYRYFQDEEAFNRLNTGEGIKEYALSTSSYKFHPVRIHTSFEEPSFTSTSPGLKRSQPGCFIIERNTEENLFILRESGTDNLIGYLGRDRDEAQWNADSSNFLLNSLNKATTEDEDIYSQTLLEAYENKTLIVAFAVVNYAMISNPPAFDTSEVVFIGYIEMF